MAETTEHGLFHTLTPEEQAKVLAYEGDDTVGKYQPTDAACDRAYREGWMQAFREWSDCLRVTFPAIVSQADVDRMERRKQEMESYGKQI